MNSFISPAVIFVPLVEQALPPMVSISPQRHPATFPKSSCSCLQLLAFNLRHNGINIRPQLVDLGDGGFQFGIKLGNIHHFAVVFGFDIAADREVVVVGGDASKCTDLAKCSTSALLSNTSIIFSMCSSVRMLLLVSFLKQTAGINKLGVGIGFVLGQHQNIHGNGGAEKQVGR